MASPNFSTMPQPETRKYNVVIDLQGMQRYSTQVEADDVRHALDAGWGRWSLEVPHPTRVLAEHRGTLDCFVTEAPQ